MDIPKDLKGEARKQWKKLFAACFRPKSEVEVEMSKRYVNWFLCYEAAKETVDREGTVVQGGNGVPYPSPHFSNMVKAEGEMRRLWNSLADSMVAPQDDTTDLGEFKGL